ncbi:MAG: endolytic transglycosylase MltG [Porphyromonas sp.]|nr:endolytic transglycosylase MltG [Porphyromonas sp.]
MRSKKGWVGLLVILPVLAIAAAGYLYYRYTKQSGFNVGGDRSEWLYVYPDMDWERVADSVGAVTHAPLLSDLRLHFKHRAKGSPRTGAYQIEPDMTVQALYNRLVYGMQSPVSVHFNSSRLPGQIYRRIAHQLMVDSLDIATAMNDTVLLHYVGVADTTLVYYLVPNTYEMYWDSKPEEVVKRLAKASQSFWDNERRLKAERIGLTPYEVINLAAIVQEESNKVDEYPMIAGLYLNRLRMGMPLQADPTIKFALQDFGLRRILYEHLRVESPYNTYKYKGLPKGPIRIPSIDAIDGVLDAVDHHYIYMCAKSDFSGYHAFAETYSAHLRNARAYAKELNKRGIK